ncbi:hypothetical protein [Bradyrhizobium sp. 25ACV]
MPARLRRNKRHRLSQITPRAIELFRQGLRESDPYRFRDIKIALATALGRSKFAACPLGAEPRSLIGGDPEPVEAVLALRAELLRAANRIDNQRDFQ